MQVKVLEEYGYENALRGLSYSFKDRALEPESWWEGQYEKAQKRGAILAHRHGGHNKFLESIQVWVDIEASRAWWSEFDTYRVGVTKQSESTMHTLMKRPPTKEDFEENTPELMVEAFIKTWHALQENGVKDVAFYKEALPEGYLQRRLICTNYKQLKNIIEQRTGHRYKWWDVFINTLLEQVEHPEFLVQPVSTGKQE